MFWGEYAHRLDPKGRLILPARYRPRLSEGAVLTRGLDHNLALYPAETWRSLCEQLNQMPITQPSGRALRRLLFSGVVELTIDRQGRILIPAYLREYAALDGTVLLVGMETFVELWSPAAWQTTLDDMAGLLVQAESMLRLQP